MSKEAIVCLPLLISKLFQGIHGWVYKFGGKQDISVEQFVCVLV
jgi:hypothetical protein